MLHPSVFPLECFILWDIIIHKGFKASFSALPVPSVLGLRAGSPCVLKKKNATPLNRCITHHCRLEHVSTARYTLLTRSDIIRMSQPVWMSLSLSFLSLSLSSCFCSVSIYSPLRCCTSPQLPVFSSFGLFSLHLSPFLHSLPLLPPVLYPSICSRLYSCLCERLSPGRAVTTPHTGAESFYRETQCATEKQLFFTSFFLPFSSPAIHPPSLWHLLTPVPYLFFFTFPSHVPPWR